MDHDDDTPTTSTVIPGYRVADFLERLWEAARYVRATQKDLLESLRRVDYSQRTDTITTATVRARLDTFQAALVALAVYRQAAKALDLPASTVAIATGTDRDAFWAEYDAWREA